MQITSFRMKNLLFVVFRLQEKSKDGSKQRRKNNNNNNNDLLKDPLGGSSLLNYINYNYKINRIKLFTNYRVELQ